MNCVLSQPQQGTHHGNGEMTWSSAHEAVRKQNFFEIEGSKAMKKVFWQMTKIRQDTNVLFTGESGTGKTNAARVTHSLVHEDKKTKVVEVNVAAFSQELIASELFGHKKGAFTGATENRNGHFEDANNGSIIIDEIGEIPASVQVKMLSALDKPRRIEKVGSNDAISLKLLAMCATTQDLVRLVQERKFHEPLYERLRQKIIHMPSLKERGPEYIRHLVQTLLQKIGQENSVDQPFDIHAETLEKLMHMSFPGNLRDLRYLLEEMCGQALEKRDRVLTNEHLHIALESRGSDDFRRDDLDGETTIERMERELILKTLKETGGDVTAAAKAVGRGRATIYRKLQDWGIVRSRMRWKENS
jgi:DNA-binding NtrC family response regulator